MLRTFRTRAWTERYWGGVEGVNEPCAGGTFKDMVRVEAVGAVEEMLRVHMRLHALMLWRVSSRGNERW
jgi:hypothetical protein